MSIMKTFMENREHDLHRTRLWQIKSTIDTRPPKTPSFMRKNLKKKQLKRERKAEIQRRNNLLLDKLYVIDTMPSNLHPYTLSKHRPPSASSLNHHAREKELDRIDRENRKILNKIQNAYSKYSIEDMMKY